MKGASATGYYCVEGNGWIGQVDEDEYPSFPLPPIDTGQSVMGILDDPRVCGAAVAKAALSKRDRERYRATVSPALNTIPNQFEAKDVDMNKDWKAYLDQMNPPGAVADFSAAAFSLQIAVNVRFALKRVEPSPECRYHAERVITAAEIYGRAREQGLTLPFSDAEKELAEAVALFAIELEYSP
ncbi:MAG: hypothetical protein QM636_14240, partial [Rhizobium sp.]